MADMTAFMQACQNYLNAQAELARMLDEDRASLADWPPEAVQYALMLLEDALQDQEA